MKTISDIHTHSLMSGHAYSSPLENISQAKKVGLKYYGMSEHAPIMEGAPKAIYFRNLKVIPNEIDGVRILKGVELNILPEGKVDLPTSTIASLDYAIASMHPVEYGLNKSVEENMKALDVICHRGDVNVIGHPNDGRFPVDFKELAKLAKETNTLIELNNSSLAKDSYRLNAVENAKEMLLECKKNGNYIIINSDAHICFAIGKLEDAYALIKEVDYPEDHIVNFNEEMFLKFLNLK